MLTTANPFDAMAILDGIRRWVEIETPTEAPAQVNRLASMVADGYRDLPVDVERIDGSNGCGKILNLRSQTEGVTVKSAGGLNRPPHEKGNAGAALYDHARTLAAEIGFELLDTSTGGGSDGNFTAPHTATLDGVGVDGKGAHTHYEQIYISSVEPRARLLHRLYQTLR